jgi:hypothetical protein
MVPIVDTRNPRAVQSEAEAVYREMFPDADTTFVARTFDWTHGCFTGKCPDYQPIDARYHDLEHTLQGTLCLVRLLRGRFRAKGEPVLSRPIFETCLIAILFHDTGYLKKRTDTEGTGAKYTANHVSRSAQFAGEFLSSHGFSEEQVISAQNMIRCTGINAQLDKVAFQSEQERIGGYALGTADLLGQMAAPDYVEKLQLLYLEFAEASRFSPDWDKRIVGFKSAEDLIAKTPEFWERYVLPHIQNDFGALYTYLNDPYPDGANPYVQQVEANIHKIRQRANAK